jgi:hypothetical protein
MLLITAWDKKGDKFIVSEKNIVEFIKLNPRCSVEEVMEWNPPEPKEPLTRKEREAQPKEPLPLSRFEGTDES